MLTYRLYIKAAPVSVWEALTSAELTRQYGYRALVEYDLRPGGSFRALATEEMKRYGAPEVLVDGEVVELDEPRRLVQTWRALWDPAMQSEGFTLVTFDIDGGEDGVTRLTITHDVSDAPRTAAQVGGELPGAGGGWCEVLCDLKTLLETGTPLSP